MTVDPLGNLICRVGQGGPKVMVAAHMDEIGLMATFVEKKTGYLRFSQIGGLNTTTLNWSLGFWDVVVCQPFCLTIRRSLSLLGEGR